MNFFEHQEQSRRHTRRLLILFVVAVLTIILAVDVALLVGLGMVESSEGVPLFSAQGLKNNAGPLAAVSLATVAVIGFSSLFKTVALRSGGGAVAQQLGGVRVDPDTRDPLKRRLANVVEEIALASGVTVPEVYVLEKEAGINAFAAGYSSSDAAIAVTRGTLEKLSRSELQGVIAHEFSHILNGDMRLNIRLMGALFGILVLSMIGRRVLFHSHFMGRSKSKDGAPIIVIAFALMAIGSVGLFFGRWIKSSVSRSREYLADASAVQFTRDPSGIGGALKKIAIYSDASYLQTDSEEIGHMLFGPGQKMNLFSSHPPLLDRISRVEPNFQEEDLNKLAARIERQQVREEEKARREQARSERRSSPFDAQSIISQIGNPDFNRLLLAATVAASLPREVSKAVHSPEKAPAMLLYSLMHEDDESRERQLLVIAQAMDPEIEAAVRQLVQVAGVPVAAQRLALLEMALPALKRHPEGRVKKLLEVIDQVIRVDQQIEVFEYLMLRMIRQFLWESGNPHRAAAVGSRPIRKLLHPASNVMAVLALHGNPENSTQAGASFRAGVGVLGGNADQAMPAVGDWIAVMDSALDELDKASPAGKKSIIEAMIATVSADGVLVPEELELMRVTAAALHVPVPVLSA